MTEELNQKISQLLDDDLSCEDALDLLRRLQEQPELQHKMSRYEAMSHVLKSEAFIPVQPGFAQRISAEIKKEPTFIVARRTSFAPPYWTLSALVASVMIVAVWVSQEEHQLSRSAGSTLVVAKTSEDPTMLKPLKVVPSSGVYGQDLQPYPGALRLAEYLQAHNSSRYIDGSVSLQPYARVVSYSQE